MITIKGFGSYLASERSKQIIGISSIVVGVAMAALATLFASGHFGSGAPYLASGSLGIASLIPFVVASLLLARQKRT